MYLHCLLQFLQHKGLVLEEESNLLHDGIDVRLLSHNHAVEVKQLGDGEKQQLFVLHPQLGHFFTPLGECLGCLMDLKKRRGGAEERIGE